MMGAMGASRRWLPKEDLELNVLFAPGQVLDPFFLLVVCVCVLVHALPMNSFPPTHDVL